MKTKVLGFFAVILFSVFVFAQVGGVAPAPSATPAAVAHSLEVVSGAVDKIPSALPAWLLAVIAFIAELGLRFWPTLQPKSLLIYGASLFALLGVGFSKLSGLLDQIVQNIKDPAPKA